MRVIKFSKAGCAPCEQVTKYLEKTGIEYETVDPTETEDFDLILKHNIRAVPVTLLLDDEGEAIKRVVGFNEQGLQEIINKYKND